ncbi:MAG: PQQ-binding-like beta-propeller repeat protein [Verrucomicrobiota bacterium]
MNSSLRFLLPFLFVLPAVLSVAAPATWDGWRGPGRHAQVPDFVPPETWPESLERMWSVVVGSGYSTALVENGRIYQQARLGGEEVLWCLDAATGEVLWRSGTSIAFRPGGGGERHGPGPKSTPVLADRRVFTLSMTGTLTAWQMTDGKQIWQRDFRDDLDKPYPYWGASTSPLVENGRVYVHLGTCEDGALFCLEGKTGADVWVQRAHANCYSSPLVEEVDGVRQLIEFNHHGLCGVDLETGEVLWDYPFPHEGRSQNTPTPALHDGLIVLGAEDRGMFAVRASQSDGGWTAEQVWRHRDVSLDMSSPVISEGVVYGFSHFKMGQFFGLDPDSGAVLWQGEPRGGQNASLVAIPGHVLALTDRGKLHVLRSHRDQPEIVRTYDVGSNGTWTAPALIGRSVLVKDGDELVRWRLR